jgi:DNA-binding LacI/PurR family transcriptional regulator
VSRETAAAPGRAVTMRQVAERAGVSPKTVSDILKGVGSFRAETKERVHRVVAELGYRPNEAARRLRSGRTDTYTLAIPELRLSYYAELASAIVRAADRRGMGIVVEPTEGTRESELELLASERVHLSDGMIFAPLGLSGDDVLPADVPTVLLGDRALPGPVDRVTMPSEEAAAAATRHLIDRGRTRIAIIGGHEDPNLGTAALRHAGYRSALEDAGLGYDPALSIDEAIWHRRDGAAAAEELLRRATPFDGIVAMNDMLALGTLRTLAKAGVRVPEDVAVIGFDDSAESAFASPSLSTIDPGIEQLAVLALDALDDRVGAGRGSAPRTFRSDYRLVARESTGGA